MDKIEYKYMYTNYSQNVQSILKHWSKWIIRMFTPPLICDYYDNYNIGTNSFWAFYSPKLY